MNPYLTKMMKGIGNSFNKITFLNKKHITFLTINLRLSAGFP